MHKTVSVSILCGHKPNCYFQAYGKSGEFDNYVPV